MVINVTENCALCAANDELEHKLILITNSNNYTGRKNLQPKIGLLSQQKKIVNIWDKVLVADQGFAYTDKEF